MKTHDIVKPTAATPAMNPTANNPNGLAHEQAEMDVAISELQEDLLELYKRFMELRDTYAKLKMRRGDTTQAQAAPTKPATRQRVQAVAEAGENRRQRR